MPYLNLKNLKSNYKKVLVRCYLQFEYNKTVIYFFYTKCTQAIKFI